MELCKKVQVTEYVFRVEESTNFYTCLRFSLLASTWFPRPLGTILWSALNIILLAYKSLVLLSILTIHFVTAVSIDAFILLVLLSAMFFGLCVLVPLYLLILCLDNSFNFLIAWIWLPVFCNCCTMPRREPGQALAHYILTAGGTLTLRPVNLEPAGVCLWGLIFCYFLYKDGFIAKLPNHLKLVSILYWRVNLVNLCREIVPMYDAVVI